MILYNNYYQYGTISNIQLFGSNYIDFNDEVEILDARYSNYNI